MAFRKEERSFRLVDRGEEEENEESGMPVHRKKRREGTAADGQPPESNGEPFGREPAGEKFSELGRHSVESESPGCLKPDSYESGDYTATGESFGDSLAEKNFPTSQERMEKAIRRRKQNEETDIREKPDRQRRAVSGIEQREVKETSVTNRGRGIPQNARKNESGNSTERRLSGDSTEREAFIKEEYRALENEKRDFIRNDAENSAAEGESASNLEGKESLYAQVRKRKETAGKRKASGRRGDLRENGQPSGGEKTGEDTPSCGYEYRSPKRKTVVSGRLFNGRTSPETEGSSADTNGRTGEFSAKSKRNFVFEDNTAKEETKKTAREVKETVTETSRDYTQLITKPLDTGKRTFGAGGRVLSKNFGTVKELSSGEQDSEQMIQSKASGTVKSLMVKTAIEAAKLPIRLVKAAMNLALTIAAAVSTSGFSILIGVIAVILSVIVFIVCIVFAACGILWIGQRQGYVQVSDFPSLQDFLEIYNWLLEIFRLMGDMFL